MACLLSAGRRGGQAKVRGARARRHTGSAPRGAAAAAPAEAAAQQEQPRRFCLALLAVLITQSTGHALRRTASPRSHGRPLYSLFSSPLPLLLAAGPRQPDMAVPTPSAGGSSADAAPAAVSQLAELVAAEPERFSRPDAELAELARAAMKGMFDAGACLLSLAH